MSDVDRQPFGYTEFGRWYDDYRHEVLDPALETATGALGTLAEGQLPNRERARIRSLTGRVKSKRRTWRKINNSRYADRIHSVDDIPLVIDDLVGLRITCINVRDIEMVQGALDALPSATAKANHLWLVPDTERDYVIEPKPSGYRGWHVGLGLRVQVPDQKRTVPVICELQVRTILQDGWGELTHEDAYAKDGELPPLVEVLSRRMADLLATLDDIAEDLRDELERIDVVAVSGSGDAGVIEDASDTDQLTEQAADAVDVLLDHWHRQDRPIDIASLAWSLQTEFGAEISDGWFGHRTFKRFLTHAIPDGEITTGPQAFLLPPQGDDPIEEAADVPDDVVEPREVPGSIRRLRGTDQAFPLLSVDEWHRIYELLASAWVRVGPSNSTDRLASQLARLARDQSNATGLPVSKRYLRYVAEGVASRAERPLDADEIAQAFATRTIERLVELRFLKRDGPEQDRLIAWLGQ